MLGSKVFFSEEKKQKTFANSDPGAACKVRDSTRKSLLVLFFRKERLPFSARAGSVSFRVGIILALCAALAACGKAGSPSAPGPSDQITYPKVYPTH